MKLHLYITISFIIIFIGHTGFGASMYARMQPRSGLKIIPIRRFVDVPKELHVQRE